MTDYKIDDLPDRIARKIAVDPVTSCWLWQGALTGGRKGSGGEYGTIKWERKMHLVHRIVYTLLVKPIPDGLTIDHVKARGCRYKHCCWPEHLEPVTGAVNGRRGDSPWAKNRRKTRCKRGHEFTPANTYISPRGERICRICQRDKQRRYLGYTGQRDDPWTLNATKTRCKRGHEFTPANTYIDRAGARQCRKCNSIRQQEYLARKRQAGHAARNDTSATAPAPAELG